MDAARHEGKGASLCASGWEIHETDKNKPPGGELVFVSAVTANRTGVAVRFE